MRLSDVLNKAPETCTAQVENFLGFRKVPWGQHRNIRVGRVVKNCRCSRCGGDRSFVSGDQLSCLMTTERSVSIDVCLKCSACDAKMEAWFLVAGDDLFSQSPRVYLERYSENRREIANAVDQAEAQIADLLERAQIAFDDHLGAGAMIYLRKVFEMTTVSAAELVGVPVKTSNEKRKPFRSLLKEVNERNRIIPREFSNDGYRLFSELSEVIHGDSDEVVALKKFIPCRRLLIGVLDNIRNTRELEEAKASLGWSIVDADNNVEGVAK